MIRLRRGEKEGVDETAHLHLAKYHSNKIRSLLTILSVGFSLALMTVLYGVSASS